MEGRTVVLVRQGLGLTTGEMCYRRSPSMKEVLQASGLKPSLKFCQLPQVVHNNLGGQGPDKDPPSLSQLSRSACSV